MSDVSYALETPCTQAVPAGTYKVSCSCGDQSRIFHVVADTGYTTCILWDGTNDGFGAITSVEGMNVLLDYMENENPHDEHTVIIDPAEEQQNDGGTQAKGHSVQVVEPEMTEVSSLFRVISAMIGVIAALLAGYLLAGKGDDDDD